MKRAMQFKRPANTKNGAQAIPVQSTKKGFTFSRFPIMVLVLVASAGATLAFCEFVVWNRLPAELVGKWTVEGGPQDGATFDSARSGSLEAHLNNNDMEHVLKGTAAVKDRTLLITTQNPNTRQDETRACKIRELTETSLIVEFEKGEVFKMVRAQ